MPRYRDNGLLLEPAEKGYPTDYLLSRVRGRRTHLIADWGRVSADQDPFLYLSSGSYDGFISSKYPEGIWIDLMKEFRWVYCRMNERLREDFFFFLSLCGVQDYVHMPAGGLRPYCNGREDCRNTHTQSSF